MGGKWLQLLTEIAAVKRVTAMFNPDTAPYVQSWYLPSLEGWAKSLNVALVTAPVRNDTEIEMVINALEPREDGLIAMPDGFMIVHRGSIISAAARNKVPAVYWLPIFVADGGLLSYGPEFIDIFRRSASYVDRILRGAKPADLPVQLPARFQMVLNARTAKELGLDVPPSILVRADEVIE
jgi:putative tryptophan/tyrosine transport system substrate-binding protein